jgi:hypothetical protein
MAEEKNLTFNFHFNAPVGQNIAHVDKLEAHFDKDMSMQIVDTEAVMNKSKEKMSSFSLLVSKPDCAEAVLMKLHELVDRQSEPRNVVMPIRAAMEAGVISRPTWVQFCTEFGAHKLSSKSSLTKYTGDSYAYFGEDFWVMKEEFKILLR